MSQSHRVRAKITFMDWIYLAFVIFLFVLAISDLWVGVSNDAVNFLNSAIGSKSASFKVIITVAAIGVFCGAIMSNGMMDVARHGVFRPEQFAFSELMIVFLAVMVTDIILLDAFNSLGMPTSTTVSLVFELLGASFALAIVKMTTDDTGLGFSDYLNTSKALQMIIAIFISVAIAFVVGLVVQWITRLIFTFNYKPGLKWKIGIFGGIAVTCILYFMLFKGLKSMSFMTDDLRNWLSTHTWTILGCCLAVSTIVMQLLYFMKVNVFKVIVLIGTFALATAFAGNDLVNFIGVPLTGFASWQDWQASGAGDPSTHMMGVLNDPAKTPFVFLFIAGVVMVVALATSRKAHNVSKTELNLARQEEGEEMFGSSKVARSLVRFCNLTSRGIIAITPVSVRSWIDRRFDKSYIEIEDGAQYDLVRASVNLVTASLLIALGTSLKLPLSTTYVTFMVAMATSLADRAWSRESAVYRITGVLSVIGGWFLTAAIAFVAAFIVALLMHWGGIWVVCIIVLAGLAALIHSNIKYKIKDDSENGDKLFRAVLNANSQEETNEAICRYIASNESKILEMVSHHYRNVTDGMMTENVKMLRKSFYALQDEKGKLKNVRRKETICIRKFDKETAMTKDAWFFTSFNELEQLYYSIRRICEPVYEHIDNHFTPIPEQYSEDFTPERNKLLIYLETVTNDCENGNYLALKDLEPELKSLRKDFSNKRKALREDIRENRINMNAGYLYLNVLQESEQMTIILKQMIRSSRKFQLS